MEETSWNRETDNKLFALRLEGLSFSQIAAILGKTKNAVIGRYGRQKNLRDANSPDLQRFGAPPLSEEEVKRIFELRKQGLGTPAIAAQLGRSQNCILKKIKAMNGKMAARDITLTIAPSKEYKSPKREAYQSFAASGGVTLMELTPHTCRWPVGDPRHDNFRFCGDYAEPGRVYCCQHYALAYYRTSPISNSRIKEMQRV